MDSFIDENTTTSTTALPLVKVQAKVSALGSRIKICVREDNVRALTAEFKRQRVCSKNLC